MHSSGRKPHGSPRYLHLPPWLLLALAPFGLAAAIAIGRAERAVLAARLAAAAAATGLTTPGSSGGGGGGVMLALLPIAMNVAIATWALRAFQLGLVRRVQVEAAFPMAPLLTLVCINVVCWVCSRPLGITTVWGSVMAMALWIFQGPLEYHDDQ